MGQFLRYGEHIPRPIVQTFFVYRKAVTNRLQQTLEPFLGYSWVLLLVPVVYLLWLAPH